MAHYRIYRMDSVGLFKDGAEADCDGDDEACRLAEDLLGDDEHAEIWHEGRLVGQVGATEAGKGR